MKNLLYKEFSLCLHPVVIIFVLLFPFMTLIPSYPLCVSSIYICACYPILFLGANKGVQTNDLLFSVLLPVRKKDIVLSRLILCSLLQVFSLSISKIILLVSRVFSGVTQITQNNEIPDTLVQVNEYGVHIDPNVISLGFEKGEFVFVAGFALLAFCIYDFIFFTLYYRNGKSVLLSTLLGILIFCIIVFTTTLILPINNSGYKQFFLNLNILHRLSFFMLVVLVYFGFHFLTYKVSAYLLEKVDF